MEKKNNCSTENIKKEKNKLRKMNSFKSLNKKNSKLNRSTSSIISFGFSEQSKVRKGIKSKEPKSETKKKKLRRPPTPYAKKKNSIDKNEVQIKKFDVSPPKFSELEKISLFANTSKKLNFDSVLYLYQFLIQMYFI